MEISQLKRINLAEFLARHYQVSVSNGKAHCPFHPPDNNSSFSVYQNGGEAWGWKDFHDDSGGSILDFVARMESLSLNDAIRRIKELEGIGGITQTRPPAKSAQTAPGIPANPPSPSDQPTQQAGQVKATRPERKIEKIYDYVDENGKLVFQKIRYTPKAFACRRPAGTNGSEWLYSLKGLQAVPYRLDKIKSEKLVYICEGEKDADLLASLGYPSTSAPSGASSWPSEINKYFRDKVIYFLYDVGNDDKVQRIAAQLWEFTQKIAVLSLPLKQREADVSDYLAPFKTDEEKKTAFGELINQRKKFEPQIKIPAQSTSVFQPSLVERASDSVRVRPIPWLWHGVLPTHMATAITGDAGQGKSLIAVDMAARISCGEAFPVYDKPSPPIIGHVFYVTSEGVPDMILVPRLIAAGADLRKITIIEGIYTSKGHFSMFDITQNLPQVEKRAQDFPDLKLVIFDPIASFLPERINTNQQNAVRQAMDRISEFALKLGIAVPTIMHFSKTTGVKAIYRTAGSHQFEAAVKMSWSVVRREDDPRNVRVLVPQKSNITGGYKSLIFSIREVKFPVPENPDEIITTAKISYGDLIEENPEILISPAQETDNNVLRACDFLKRRLQEEKTLYAGPLISEAERNGLPKWALYKAKDRLGVAHDKEPQFQGRTFWFMPERKGLA